MNKSSFVLALITAILSTTAYAQWSSSKESQCASLQREINRGGLNTAEEEMDQLGPYHPDARIQLRRLITQQNARVQRYEAMGCRELGFGFDDSPFIWTDKDQERLYGPGR